MEAKQYPRDRKELIPVVFRGLDGRLEFCLLDSDGKEYEIEHQISFTFDRNFPSRLDQVAVVMFVDKRFTDK